NKIPAGKYIILEESDVISVGDLEVQIKTHNQTVPVEEIPEIPEEDEIVDEATEEEVVEEAEEIEDEVFDEEEIEDEEEVEEKPKAKPVAPTKKKKPALVSFGAVSIQAS